MNDKDHVTSNERLENVFATFTHEQLVRKCASLSEALDAANLDSAATEAQLLLGRVLAELEPMAAKNVRLYRDIKAFLEGLPVETTPRHTLDCDMVKHPNCTQCNCGSSIDTHRASSGERSDQPHTRAQVVLDTASGSVRVSVTDPSGTPQDIGRASGSEARHEREPNPGSGVPAPGAAVRCSCGHSDHSHFIGSTDIKGPCGVCSCMEWSPEEPSRNQTTNSSGESSLTATASGDTGGAGLLPAASSPDQLCKRCRHSYAQHTKGAVPDDYCRHCVCPAFVPYSPEKSTASHTTEDDFQHWLSYSGVGAASDADLRAAYYAGANMPPAKRFDPESLAAEAEEFLAEHLDLSDAGLQFRRAIQLMRDMLACARGAGPAQEPTAPRWRHDWETLPGPSYRCKRCSTSCLDAHAALLCVVEPEKGSGEQS